MFATQCGTTALLTSLYLIGDLSGFASRTVAAEQPPASKKRDSRPGTDARVATEPLASADSDGNPLPRGALRRLGPARFRQYGPYASIAFLPSGSGVVTTSHYGHILYWDLHAGRLLRLIRNADSRTDGSLAVSADGRLLATTERDAIDIRKLATGELQRRIPCDFPTTGRSRSRLPLAFSFRGDALACQSADGTVRVWDPTTGKELFRSSRQGAAMETLTFSQDGTHLFGANSPQPPHSSALSDWELPSRKVSKIEFHSERGKDLVIEALSADGKMLALSHQNSNRVHLWDVAMDRERFQMESLQGRPVRLVFSPDCSILAATDAEHLYLWEVVTGKLRHRIKRQAGMYDVYTMNVAFSPDSKTVAVASYGVFAWDVASGQPVRHEVEAHNGTVSALLFSDDGDTLCSAARDRSLHFWNYDTGRLGRRIVLRDNQAPYLSLSPDGASVAFGHKSIEIRDFSTGKDVRAFQETFESGGRIYNTYFGECPVQFSSDGTYVAGYGVSDRCAYIWDVKTGKAIFKEKRVPSRYDGSAEQKYPPHFPAIKAKFHPDLEAVALLFSGCLGLQDVRTGQEILTLSGPENPWDLTFSRDWATLASGCGDGSVRVWEVATGKEVIKREGLSYPRAHCFAPEGRRLAIAAGRGEQATIHVLSAATGETLQEFRGHGSQVESLLFAPDGKTLVSGLHDSTMVVWDVTPSLRIVQGSYPSASPDLDQAWEALAGEDAAMAHVAIWSLIKRPSETIPYFKKRVRAANATEMRQLDKLLGGLESDDFATRETVTKELRRIAPDAWLELRMALAVGKSEEEKRRLEDILKMGSRRPAYRSERLRSLRAIRVLEQIGSDDAKSLLRGIALGAPLALKTQLAKASLARLQKHPSASR